MTREFVERESSGLAIREITRLICVPPPLWSYPHFPFVFIDQVLGKEHDCPVFLPIIERPLTAMNEVVSAKHRLSARKVQFRKPFWIRLDEYVSPVADLVAEAWFPDAPKCRKYELAYKTLGKCLETFAALLHRLSCRSVRFHPRRNVRVREHVERIGRTNNAIDAAGAGMEGVGNPASSAPHAFCAVQPAGENTGELRLLPSRLKKNVDEQRWRRLARDPCIAIAPVHIQTRGNRIIELRFRIHQLRFDPEIALAPSEAQLKEAVQRAQRCKGVANGRRSRKFKAHRDFVVDAYPFRVAQAI